jgi:dienelactone hydrolase
LVPSVALPQLPADPTKIPAYVGANGKFSKPGGRGPFPSVVIMHGCGGPPEHYEWAKRLHEWGYAA